MTYTLNMNEIVAAVANYMHEDGYGEGFKAVTVNFITDGYGDLKAEVTYSEPIEEEEDNDTPT